MAIEVFMPKNGMAMEEGTIVRWLKNVGDTVEMDEPIMEIETDKITMESEAPGSGVLLAKLYEDGAVVPVLTTIGYIGKPGEKVPEAAAPAAPSAAAEPEAAAPVAEAEAAPAKLSGDGVAATPYAKKLASEAGIALSDVPASGKHGEVKAADVEKVKATPLAQRIATGLGVDLAGVAGSGHAGKVTKDDVLAAAAAPAATSMEVTRKPLTGMRKVIADRMTQSHLQIPPVTHNMSNDVTALLALRETINAGREKDKRISINDFIVKACAIAVSENDMVRSSIEGNELVTKAATNIGFAVGLEDGLIVPVIRDADKLSLSKLSEKAKELAGRARNGGLRPDEYSGSTFTISNLGMFQVDSFTPIINQPDAAIMGVNRVRDELALDAEGNVVVKKVVTLSLTYDHRILDGMNAAKFQLRVKELLENPMEILI